MTKKEFKELCNDQTYTGWNGQRIRINAFFFDYKSGTTADGKYFGGYKYMVSASYKSYTKAELLNMFYHWFENDIDLPVDIGLKCANSDEKRFKISLSL